MLRTELLIHLAGAAFFFVYLLVYCFRRYRTGRERVYLGYTILFGSSVLEVLNLGMRVWEHVSA